VNNNNTVPTGKSLNKESEMTPLKLKILKFERASWRFINYSILFGSILRLYWNEYYAFNMDLYFEGWPSIISPNLNTIYAMEVGHYFYACMVIHLEPKTKDKFIMFSHHVSTLLLLIGSHCNSFCRVGVVVLLITDVSDPILECAKACQYLGLQWAADFGFNLFAALFIICRNILYPYFILIPTFGETCMNLPGTGPLRILLVFLQFLFFYWSRVIINIAWNVILGRGASDIRDEE